jgi:hypothetical protein
VLQSTNGRLLTKGVVAWIVKRCRIVHGQFYHGNRSALAVIVPKTSFTVVPAERPRFPVDLSLLPLKLVILVFLFNQYFSVDFAIQREILVVNTLLFRLLAVAGRTAAFTPDLLGVVRLRLPPISVFTSALRRILSDGNRNQRTAWCNSRKGSSPRAADSSWSV